jgi:hypothetical protein
MSGSEIFVLIIDALEKSQKMNSPVIPANPGSGSGQAPESSK